MTEWQLRELTPGFGTEITGLDPPAALADDGARRRLRSLFDTRGLLVFRDLDVDQRGQADLVRALIGLGPLAPGESPTGRPDGAPFLVSNKEPGGGVPYGRLLFHSDMMWSEHTFQVLSLYGVEIEPPVAPTLFAGAVAAWRTLPEDLRARVEPLTATHGHDQVVRARAVGDPDVLVTTFEQEQTRHTPVGYPHPRTGDTVLYVAQQMTVGIDGVGGAESEALLDELFTHLYRPENRYEHEWRHHDLVAWDNIAVQHARPNVTLEGPVRTLRKVFAPVPPREAHPSSAPRFARAG